MPDRARGLRTSFIMSLPTFARALPRPMVLAMRPVFAGALRSFNGSGWRVEQCMRAALGSEGYGKHQVRDYFARIADLTAYSILVYRFGIKGAGLERSWAFDSDSQRIFQEVLARKKGAVMAAPHLTGMEIMAGAITDELPITVMARRSSDEPYQALKERWYAQVGLDVAYRPRKGSKFEGLEEMAGALRVLRKNRVLTITPDLLRKPGTGVPVKLFGRDAELPSGPFFLALRTGAPLVPSFFHYQDGVYHLRAREPITPRATDRDEAIREAAQIWTTMFEEFMRQHPEMWTFWLDKRWSRWLLEGK